MNSSQLRDDLQFQRHYQFTCHHNFPLLSGMWLSSEEGLQYLNTALSLDECTSPLYMLNISFSKLTGKQHSRWHSTRLYLQTWHCILLAVPGPWKKFSIDILLVYELCRVQDAVLCFFKEHRQVPLKDLITSIRAETWLPILKCYCKNYKKFA